MADLGVNAAGELIWRCDQCQHVFEVEWVGEDEGEIHLPALANDAGDWCDACFLAEYPDGVYEPE